MQRNIKIKITMCFKKILTNFCSLSKTFSAILQDVAIFFFFLKFIEKITKNFLHLRIIKKIFFLK